MFFIFLNKDTLCLKCREINVSWQSNFNRWKLIKIKIYAQCQRKPPCFYQYRRKKDKKKCHIKENLEKEKAVKKNKKKTTKFVECPIKSRDFENVSNKNAAFYEFGLSLSFCRSWFHKETETSEEQRYLMLICKVKSNFQVWINKLFPSGFIFQLWWSACKFFYPYRHLDDIAQMHS